MLVVGEEKKNFVVNLGFFFRCTVVAFKSLHNHSAAIMSCEGEILI